MKRWSRYTTFALTILMVLAISAMQVVPVLADDGAPPPPEATEAVPPPEENPSPEQPPAEAPTQESVTDVEETPAVEEVPVLTEESPVSTEAAPALAEAPADVSAAEETPVKESASEEATPAEVLAQLPENTEIVILDENGETLSLATQEAEDILYSGDPVWCPVGALPGSASCSDVYTSLNELVANFVPPTNGVIWIENTDVTIADVIISGGSGGNWEAARDFSLTLQGGWNPLVPGGVITNTPSTMDNLLIISSWNGNITLSDITITGASGAGFALSIDTTKTITLKNVDVVDNTTTNGGAYLNNSAGSSNVVVNDSTFSGNSGTDGGVAGLPGGLVIRSRGNVSIKNLSAHNNGGAGVDIDTRMATSAKTVTMTGSNNFNNNGGNGLSVYARGAITLSNVISTYNGGRGATLDNCAYDGGTGYCTEPFSAGVILKGSSNFSNNGGDGLYVISGGTITAANLTASDNGATTGNGQGAYLDNWGSFFGKPITLTGVNTFNGNAGAGLWIDSWGAVITNNLDANDNGNGATCTTEACDGVHVNHSASFLLAGYGRFNRSGNDGLEVQSWGVVTLNNLYAEENDYRGVFVSNHAPYGTTEAVNVLGTNVFLNNLEEGLRITTQGAVTLNNITASGNGANLNESGAGVYVVNTQKYNPVTGTWIIANKNVTLKGLNTFDNNAGNGLTVFSTGVILASGLSANDNGSSGAYLDNCLYDAGTSDCTGLPGKAVTLNGNNSFSLNGLHGLWIASLGNIKVNNLASIYNDVYGALLNNDWTTANGGVTITGFANTSWNGSLGLGIYSRGAVLTNNLTANYNGPTSAGAGETSYRGVYINNAGDQAKLSNVTLLGVNTFNNNWNTGLFITSYGNVLLNNITATGNGEPAGASNPTPLGTGVYVVNNVHPTAVRTVTLNGINFFNNNLDTGLDIRSRGAVIVSKPTAIGNGVRGVNIENNAGFSAMPVTILGYGTFNDNGTIGLAIFSNGNITLNNILASGNTSHGVALSNENFADTAAPVNVTLNGVNTFNNNDEHGLVVFSDGTITINNITANENGWSGAYLDNFTHRKLDNPRNIVLKGWGTFINNTTGNGLEFYATGAVSLTRITANENGIAGVTGDAGSSITFTCGSLFANTGSGYTLTAGTTITLKGVYTYGNTLANSATPAASITRTCPIP